MTIQLPQVAVSQLLDVGNPRARDLVGLYVAGVGSRGDRWHDLSVRRNHGTLTDMTPSSAWQTSEVGMTLAFDGSNDYVDIPAAFNFSGTLPLTVAWTAKCNVSEPAAEGMWSILSAIDDIEMWCYAWDVDNDNSIVVAIQGTVFSREFVQWDDDITQAEYARWAAVWEGGGVYRLYRNGVENGRSTGSTPTKPGHSTSRLGMGHPSFPGNVNIRDLAIWERALGASEVREHGQDAELGFPDLFGLERRTIWPVAAAGGEETATLAVVSAAASQPATTATYAAVVSAGVAEIAASVDQPSVTAGVVAVYEAGTAVVVGSVAQPAVTGSVGAEAQASVAVVVSSVAAPAVTGSHASEWSASLAAIVASAAQPAATATWVAPLSASLEATVAIVAQPAVTASGVGPQTASLAVVVATVAQPAVTAVGVSVTTKAGPEYTVPAGLIHYTAPEERPHYTVPDE